MTSPSSKFAHFLALATTASTLFLVCVGAIVTSKGVGMAVPDWPTSYGFNKFLLPIDKWKKKLGPSAASLALKKKNCMQN